MVLLELLAYDLEGDVSGKLVAFERDIFRYEQSSKEKITDSIKMERGYDVSLTHLYDRTYC